MNHFRKSSHSRTNPASVLNQIGAQTVGEIKEQAELRQSQPQQAPTRKRRHTDLIMKKAALEFDPQQRAEVVKAEFNDRPMIQLFRADAEPTKPEDMIQSTIESALQIQQLAAKLRETEATLASREHSLQVEVSRWEESLVQQKTEITQRLADIEQQASHVRCQQKQLMELQSNIVESYEAVKESVETLVSSDCSDQQTVASLRALKHEVNERFDFIFRRWSHLLALLQHSHDELCVQAGKHEALIQL